MALEENKIQNSETSGNETQQPTNSYAVRPKRRHLRPLTFSNQDNMLRTRNYLNLAFMLLAIAGVIMWTQMDDRTPANVVLIIAVVIKIAEVCIRLFKK